MHFFKQETLSEIQTREHMRAHSHTRRKSDVTSKKRPHQSRIHTIYFCHLRLAKSYMHSGLTIQCHTDIPYRQDPNLGEDKGGLLGPKKDKYKLCSLLAKAHKKFWVFSWLDSQFCQALRYQNRSRGLVWHYIPSTLQVYFKLWV